MLPNLDVLMVPCCLGIKEERTRRMNAVRMIMSDRIWDGTNCQNQGKKRRDHKKRKQKERELLIERKHNKKKLKIPKKV